MTINYSAEEETKNFLKKSRDSDIPDYVASVVINQLTSSIENVSELLGDKPSLAKKYLKFCINPLTNFYEDVFEPLMALAKDKKSGSIKTLAEELKKIRQYYDTDDIEIQSIHKREIESINKETVDEKKEAFDKFTTTATKFHIGEVIKQLDNIDRTR